MKNVTITGQWINQYQEKERGEIMRMIFSLADQHGFNIRVAGQRWR